MRCIVYSLKYYPFRICELSRYRLLSTLYQNLPTMGSVGVTDTIVSLPDNKNAWSCTSLPVTTNRKPITEQHISELRQLLQNIDDGSILLAPGDDGYEESLKRWSRAAEKRAVSTISTILPVPTLFDMSRCLPSIDKVLWILMHQHDLE